MKKTRKILAMAACAILLVCISVGATVAYLTDMEQVVNTFTVGKVAITLDEAKVNANGEPVDKDGNVVALANAPRVKENSYKLMPGHSYVKDPTVHFEAGSEASYLFVKVENDIESIEDNYNGKENIEQQIQSEANGWTELLYIRNADNKITATVYYKLVGANTGDSAIDYKVFDGFKIKDDAAIDSFAPETTVNAEGKIVYTKQTKVTVTAYAVQADGFATAKAAWDATFGVPSTNP